MGETEKCLPIAISWCARVPSAVARQSVQFAAILEPASAEGHVSTGRESEEGVNRGRHIHRLGLLTVSVLLTGSAWSQQQMSSYERGRATDMLQTMANDVKKHYLDPKFHGVDFEGKVAEARKQIEASKSFNMAMSHIAAALDTLNDSHTFFLPPQKAIAIHMACNTGLLASAVLSPRCAPEATPRQRA